MVNEETKVIETLEKCGIGIELLDDISEDKLIKNGYKKVSNEAKVRFNELFKYIPGIAVEAVKSKEAVAKSKKLLEGAYRVSIKDGMHLAKSRLVEGAFSGNALSDQTNGLAGAAAWFEIKDKLKLSDVPRFTLWMFDALSAVVGQYYMTEINHKLEIIEDNTQKILRHIENKIKSELEANDKTLDEIFRNACSFNEMGRPQYHGQVLSIRKSSREKIFYFLNQIKNEMNNISKKIKTKDIEKFLNSVNGYYEQYWYEIRLYIKSILCEMVLMDSEPELLKKQKREIIEIINEYQKSIDENLSIVRAISRKGMPWDIVERQEIETFEYLSAPTDEVLTKVAVKLYKKASEYNENKREKKLEEGLTRMEELGNVELLIKNSKKIDEYILINNSPLDIVQINENVYFKMLE